jgi:hypothetical protein
MLNFGNGFDACNTLQMHGSHRVGVRFTCCREPSITFIAR